MVTAMHATHEVIVKCVSAKSSNLNFNINFRHIQLWFGRGSSAHATQQSKRNKGRYDSIHDLLLDTNP